MLRERESCLGDHDGTKITENFHGEQDREMRREMDGREKYVRFWSKEGTCTRVVVVGVMLVSWIQPMILMVIVDPVNVVIISGVTSLDI